MGPSILPTSLSPHWDLLWFLVVVLAGGAIIELRLALRSLGKKWEKLMALHAQCQLELIEKFVLVKDFEELKLDRTKRWDKHFFFHTHFTSGEVKINRVVEE